NQLYCRVDDPVQGRGADGKARLVSTWMKVRASTEARLERNQDVKRLLAQIDVVRTPGLHSLLRNRPDTRFEIDLIPGRVDELRLSYHRQQHELHRQSKRG